MTLHKPVIYGPAIEALQAFAAVGCCSFSRHDAVPLRAALQEGGLLRSFWRHHLVQ